jgi:hypothetical protein
VREKKNKLGSGAKFTKMPKILDHIVTDCSYKKNKERLEMAITAVSEGHPSAIPLSKLLRRVGSWT